MALESAFEWDLVRVPVRELDWAVVMEIVTVVERELD